MSGRIKGITIEIGGETTGLSKALSGVNREISSTQNELRQVERLLKLDPSNTELIAQKQELLAKNVENTKDKLSQLKNVQEQVKKQFENGEIDSSQYRAFQREIINTESSLENLGERLEDTSLKFDYLGTSSGKINGIMKNAGVAAIGAAGGLFAMAVNAGAAADDINTLAAQTGLSIEQIQIFQYATDVIDVSIGTLTGSMAKLIKNMQTAANGSKNIQGAFNALGVSITDNDGKLRNNQEVFGECISALSTMTDETQRDAYAMQIFGKSAQDLNPLILGGVDALNELGIEARNAGLILDQETLDAANEFNDAMDRIKATTTGVFARIGSEIADELTPMVEPAAKNIADFMNFILDNRDEVVAALGAVAAGLAMYNSVVGIQSVITAVQTMITAVKSATTAQAAFNAVMLSNPAALVASAIAALVAGLYIYNSTADTAANKTKALIKESQNLRKSTQELIEETNNLESKRQVEKSTIDDLIDRLYDLESQSGDTAEKKAEMQSIVEQLNSLIPDLNLALDAETGKLNIQKKAVQDLAQEYINLAYAKAYAEKIEISVKKKIDLLEKNEELAKTKNTDVSTSNTFGIESLDRAVSKRMDDRYKNKIQKEINKNNLEIEKLDESIKQSSENAAKYAPKPDGSGEKLGDEEAIARMEKEAAELKEKLKLLKKGEDTGRKSAAKSSKKSSDDSDKKAEEARKQKVQLYKDEITETERLNDRHIKLLKGFDNLKEEHEVSYLEESANRYREYAADVLKQTYMKESEQAELYQQYSEKAQDLELEAYTKSKELLQKRKDEAMQTLKEIADKYSSEMANIESMMNTFSSKLKNYGSLYNTVTTTYKNMGDGLVMRDGNLVNEVDKVFTETKLTDIAKDIEAMTKYRDMLLQVQDKGVNLDFFTVLRDMDITEGMTYMDTLLNASEEEFNKYISDWEQKQAIADEISKKVYRQDAENVATEYIDTMTDAIAEVPDVFGQAGEDCAKAFGDELIKEFEKLSIELKTTYPDLFKATNIPILPIYTSGGNDNVSNTKITNVEINTSVSKTDNTPYEVAEQNRRMIERMGMTGVI